MRARLRTTLLAGAAAAALAQGAAAADVAVLMAADGAPEAALALFADVLNAQGYEVYDRPAADRADVFAALSEALERLEEIDRLILAYAGPVAGAGPLAWLLPGEGEGAGLLEAAEAGVGLDVLLALAAERPGRAAVVVAASGLGAEDDAAEAEPLDFPALALGVGAPEAPQGVLLVAGEAEAVLEAATEGLFAEGGVAEALAEPPEGVEAFGFLAPNAAFVATAPGAAAPPPERAEAAPEPEAEPEAEAEVEAAPEGDPAEAAEAALGLDQAARRRIQEQLTVLGYGTRGIDGIFGPGTRAAVADWQRAQELEGTGFVTTEQLQLLGALAEARSAELATAAETARLQEEAEDAAFWRTTGAGGTAADYRAYLGRYPDGIYAGEARAALDRLEAEARAEAGAADSAAWAAAETAGDAEAWRAYLQANPDGAFVDQARARLDELERAPERARADEAAGAAEEGLGLNRGSRALIEGQLAALGYDVGDPDGTFNNRTRRALREFQTRQGLAVTGYVNQETVQALIIASLGLR